MLVFRMRGRMQMPMSLPKQEPHLRRSMVGPDRSGLAIRDLVAIAHREVFDAAYVPAHFVRSVHA